MADTPAGPARPSELVQENAAEVATPNPLGSLMGLGSIGSTLNVVRDLLSGKPVDQIEIPADVQEQALHVIMQQYGASTMEEFITNPEIMAQIKQGLHDDIQNAANPTDTIVFRFIDGMDGAQLKEMITASPQIQEFLRIEMADQIESRTTEAVAAVTVADVLNEAGVPETSRPAALSTRLVSELSVEDLTGLNNQELSTVIAAMPAEQFNATLSRIATEANLPEGTISPVAADANFETRQAAFTGALDAVVNDVTNAEFEFSAQGFKNLFASVAMTEDQIRDQVFNGIRESFTADADGNGIADGQDHIRTIQGAVQTRATQIAEEFDITTLSDEEVRNIFTENRDVIAQRLSHDDSWPMIESMITADMVRRNRDQIMEAMLPTMTQQGLTQFKDMLDGLPPGISQLISGFLEFISGLLGKAMDFAQNFGVNIPGLDGGAEETAPAVAANNQQQPNLSFMALR